MVFCWADKWLNFNLQSYYWQIYTLSKQNSWFVTQSPKKYMSKVYHIRILTTEKIELEMLEPLCYLMHRAWVQTIRWTMDLSLKLSQHERKKVIASRVVEWTRCCIKVHEMMPLVQLHRAVTIYLMHVASDAVFLSLTSTANQREIVNTNKSRWAL